MAESKIILGGDDAFFRGPLFTRLEDAGYAVSIVPRTADLVKAALSEPQDLSMLIVDLHSPKIDAAAALKTVFRERPDFKVPIVGVRAPEDRPALIQGLKQAGVKTFIDRETPFNEILYLVRQLIVPSVAERRKHPRVPSNLPIEFWAEGENHRSGFVSDISEGGIFIQSLERYVLGQDVNVRFTLGEKGRKIAAKGEVVYISPKMNRKTALLPGMGVKFREIFPDDVDAIQGYIQSVLQRLPDLYHKSLIGIDKSTM